MGQRVSEGGVRVGERGGVREVVRGCVREDV